MAKTREHLSLEEDQIELEELIGTPKPPPSNEQYKKMQEAGKKFGFVDRSPKIKKTKKRTPYIIQHNSKMRIGMKELLTDLTAYIGAKSDQETLELGILALIEKEGAKGILEKFEELTKDS